MRDLTPHRDGDVVLGDDFVAPGQCRGRTACRGANGGGSFSFRESSLTRKIVTFNLIALNVLVAGILYLNSSRDSLALQRANRLVGEVELIADVFEAQLPAGAPVNSGNRRRRGC